MVFLAPAKINLALNILHKREDGYHEVDMILQSISLTDQLDMKVIPFGIELTCNRGDLAGPNNLVWKAANLLQEKYLISQGVRIHLTKNIPTEAGLAGGSSDCAAALRGLNELWNLKLSTQELEILGARLGSDVPFCISGGTVRGQGRGEKLTPLPNCPFFFVLLVKPLLGVSTSEAYKGYQEGGLQKPPDMETMISALSKKDKNAIYSSLGNVFEEWIPKKYPLIGEILEVLRKEESIGVAMSGSGPTVFALSDSREKLEKLRNQIQKYGQTWICHTIQPNEIGGELTWE